MSGGKVGSNIEPVRVDPSRTEPAVSNDSIDASPAAETRPVVEQDVVVKSEAPADVVGAENSSPALVAPAPQNLSAVSSAVSRPTGPILATVGGTSIRPEDLEPSPAAIQSANAPVFNFAAELGVEMGVDETPEAWLERLAGAAESSGNLERLETLLFYRDQSLWAAEQNALEDAVTTAILKQGLARENVSVPPNLSPDDRLPELYRAYAEVRATALGVDISSPEVVDDVEAWLNTEFEAAFWAPYQERIGAQLGASFSPEEQTFVRNAIYSAFSQQYGLSAPKDIAEQLERPGSAARQLSALIKATNSVSWTVADLVNAGEEDPRIQGTVTELLHSAGIENPAGASLSHLSVNLGPDGLRAQSLSAEADVLTPIWDALRSGQAQLEHDPQKGLGIRSDSISEQVAQYAAIKLNAAVTQLGHEAAARWKTGGSLDALIQGSTLATFAPDEGKDWILSHPRMREALDNVVLDDVAAGRSPRDVEQRARAMGLPDERVDSLQSLAQQFGLLNEVSPLPRSLRELAAGHRDSVTVPFEGDGATNPQARETIAALQEHLIAAGFLQASDVEAFGVLNPKTIEQFRSLSTVDGRLELSATTLQRLRAHTAKKLQARNVSVAELLLTHPALRRYREAGGHADAVRFVDAYMRAQLGDGLSLADGDLTPEKLNALSSSAAAAIPEDVYAQTLSLLEHAPPTPRARYDRVMNTTARQHMRPPHGFGLVEQMSDEESRAVATRLARLTQPSFVTAVPRGELGMLPIYQPIVALKLARANLTPGMEPPIDGTGTIDAVLDAEDLGFWRTLLVEDGASPERAEAWGRVVESARRGDVVIGDLTQDVQASELPGENAEQRAADLNIVLQDLRAGLDIVRLNTQPIDEGVASTIAQRRQYQPIRKFEAPLEAAMRRYAESYGGTQPTAGAVRIDANALETMDRLVRDLENIRPTLETMIAEQEALRDATDTEEVPSEAREQALEALATAVEQKNDIVAFLDRYRAARADIAAVREGLASGDVSVVEGSGSALATFAGSDATLRRQARTVTELFVDGADILQTEARERNEKLDRALLRSGMEVRHHLLTLPGFADIEPLNALQDEHVLAFKLTRGSSEGVGVAESPTIDPETLEVRREGGAEWSTARRAELASVDADLIRALLEPRYAQFLGEGWVQKATSGLSLPLADPAEARELLARVADTMERPWTTVNVTFEDRDPDVRAAKVLMQSALAQIFQTSDILGDESLIPGREVVAAKQFVERLVAMDTPELAPSLKSFLILNGLCSVEDCGDLHDTTFGPQTIKGLLVVAKDSFESLPDDIVQDAQKHFDTLKALAAAGESVEFGHGEGGVALKRLNMTLLGGGISQGRLDFFDFDRVVGDRTTTDFSSAGTYAPFGGAGQIHIRHSRNHYGASSEDIRAIDQGLGQVMESDEAVAERFEQWRSRARFDPTRFVESAGASWVLFHKLMHTMISYDMLPKPTIKTTRAVSHWAHGEIDSDEMWTEIGHAWQEPANLLAMLTAFRTGIGFAEDVGDKIRQGNLDLAAGWGVVFAPMFYGAMRGNWATGRGVLATADRILRRGPYQVHDVTLTNTQGFRQSGQRVGIPSQLGGRATQALGFTWEAGVHPTATIREGFGALRRWIYPGRGVKMAPTTGFDFELTPEHRQWIQNNRGGTTSFTVSKGLTSHRLVLPNSALLEAAHYPEGRFPPNLARRLGIADLPNSRQFATAIAEMVKDLPRAPLETLHNVSRGVPSLESLRQNSQGSTTYELARRNVTITNATALKLIRTAHTAPARLERAALAADLTIEEARQIADGYSTESRRAIKQADRYALGTNWRERTASNIRGRFRRRSAQLQRLSEGVSRAAQRLAGRTPALTERLLTPNAMSYQNVPIHLEGRGQVTGAQMYRTSLGGVDVRMVAVDDGYRLFANDIDMTQTREGRAIIADLETSERVLNRENFRGNDVRLGGEQVRELYRYTGPDGTTYRVVHGRKGSQVFSSESSTATPKNISTTAFGQRVLHQLSATQAQTGAVHPIDVEQIRHINRVQEGVVEPPKQAPLRAGQNIVVQLPLGGGGQVPYLGQLAQNPLGHTTWNVADGNKTTSLRLLNSDVVRLTSLQHDPAAQERAVNEVARTPEQRAALNEVLGRYSEYTRAQTRAAQGTSESTARQQRVASYTEGVRNLGAAQAAGRLPAGLVAELMVRDPQVLIRNFPEFGGNTPMSDASRAKIRTWVETNWTEGAKISTNPEVVAFLQSTGAVSQSFLVNQIANGNALHVATVASFLAAEGMFRAMGIEDHHFLKLAAGMGIAGAAGFGLNRYGATRSPVLAAQAQAMGATRMERARNLIRGQVRGFGPAILSGMVAGGAFRAGTLHVTDLEPDHWFVQWGTLTASVSGAVWGPGLASRGAAGLSAWSQPLRARIGQSIVARLGETGVARYVAAFTGKRASAAAAGRMTVGQVASKVLIPLTIAEIGGVAADYFHTDYQKFENKLMVDVRKDALSEAWDGDWLTAATSRPLAAMDWVEDFFPAFQENAAHWVFYEMAHSRGVSYAADVDDAIQGELGASLIEHLDVREEARDRDDYLTKVDAADFDVHAWTQVIRDRVLTERPPADADVDTTIGGLLSQAHMLREGYPFTMSTAEHIDPEGRIANPEEMIPLLLNAPLQTQDGESNLQRIILEERRRERVGQLIAVLDQADRVPDAEREAFIAEHTTAQDASLGLVDAARRAKEQIAPHQARVGALEEEIGEGLLDAQGALQIGLEIAAVDRQLAQSSGEDHAILSEFRGQLLSELEATGQSEEDAIRAGARALDDLSLVERLGQVNAPEGAPDNLVPALRRDYDALKDRLGVAIDPFSVTPEMLLQRAVLDLNPQVGSKVEELQAEIARAREQLRNATVMTDNGPREAPVSRVWANARADEIAHAVNGLGTDEDEFMQAVEGLPETPAQLKAISDAFKQRHGEDWGTVRIAALRDMGNDSYRMRRVWNAMQLGNMEPDRAQAWMRDRVARGIGKEDTEWLRDEFGAHELRVATRDQRLTMVRMLLDDTPDDGETLHRVLNYAEPEDLAWVLNQVDPEIVVRRLESKDRIRDAQRWVRQSDDRALLQRFLTAARSGRRRR